MNMLRWEMLKIQHSNWFHCVTFFLSRAHRVRFDSTHLQCLLVYNKLIALIWIYVRCFSISWIAPIFLSEREDLMPLMRALAHTPHSPNMISRKSRPAGRMRSLSSKFTRARAAAYCEAFVLAPCAFEVIFNLQSSPASDHSRLWKRL